jgi:hypothetical protein
MTAYTIKRYTADWYVEQFREQRPFSLSRWGDGEWRAVLLGEPQPIVQRQQANCDGHRYFPAMNRQLGDVLRSGPAYRLGMQKLAVRMFGDKIEKFVAARVPGREWHDASELFYMGIDGDFGRVLRAIRDYQHIVVGPPYLKELRRLIPVHKLIAIPGRNCFTELDNTVKQVLDTAARCDRPLVVTFAASMPANIMIDRLYEPLGKTSFLLDFGSVYDGLLGKRTRRLHKQWNIPANLKWLA